MKSRAGSVDSATVASEHAPAAPAAQTPQQPSAPSPQTGLLAGWRLAAFTAGMMMSVFLIALDQTILATALPSIASDFQSFNKQGWVSSGFVLGQTSTILLAGQLLRYIRAKHMLLGAIVFFEVGSVICGSAKNMDILIFGRAFAGGLGASGIFGGAIQTMTQYVALQTRVKLFGFFGAVFGIASIAGPLLGSAFVESHLTWRWCFYINLPIGAVSFATVFFTLPSAPPLGTVPSTRTIKNVLAQVARADWLGVTIVTATLTSLTLALNWGGDRGWGNYTVVVPLVMSVVGAAVFVAVERWRDEKSMLPSQIFRSWSIVCILLYNFWVRFVMLVLTYFIPLWYQAARGDSPVQSGISLLAFMLSTVIFVIVCGQIVGKIGRYWPFLVCGPTMLCIGCGLLYTVNGDTSSAKLIGYQILCGVGIGSTMQLSMFAIQGEMHDMPRLIAQASAMSSFCQFLGGTIGLGVASGVFQSELNRFLGNINMPESVKTVAIRTPASIHSLPLEFRTPIVDAYTRALRIVFIMGVPVGILMSLTALGIKNVNIKKLGPPGPKPATSEKADDVSTEKSNTDEKEEGSKEADLAKSESKISDVA